MSVEIWIETDFRRGAFAFVSLVLSKSCSQVVSEDIRQRI